MFPVLRCLATVQTHVWSPYRWKWMDKGCTLFGILFKLLDWYKYYPWWSQNLSPSNSGWSCESIIKAGIESPHSQLYQLLKYFSLNSDTNNIQKNIFYFLWYGNLQNSKFHLPSWESISLPKCMGGWDLECLDLFNHALQAKIFFEESF